MVYNNIPYIKFQIWREYTFLNKINRGVERERVYMEYNIFYYYIIHIFHGDINWRLWFMKL